MYYFKDILKFSLYSIVICFGISNGLYGVDSDYNLVSLAKNFLHKVSELDYYESDGLFIDLPESKIFKVHWADKGSGNILQPFSSVNITIEDYTGKKASSKNDKNDKNTQFSLADLFKLFIKTKIKSTVKALFEEHQDLLDGWGWLLRSELSAIEVFGLKLYLLMRHDFGKDVDRKKVEVIRLLFRLSQSDVPNMFDYKRSLFSYLPKELADKLKLDPKWQSFIDDMWKKLALNAYSYEFDKDGQYDRNKIGVFACGYVFANKHEAQECFEKLSNKTDYSCEAFCNDVKRHISMFKEFGRVNRETSNANLPEKVKEEILAVSSFPKVKLIHVEGEQSWIIYVNDQLSAVDSVHMILVSLLKSFYEYNQIKSEDKNENQKNIDEKTMTKEMQEVLQEIDILKEKKANLKKELSTLITQEEKLLQEMKKYEHAYSSLDKHFFNAAQEKYNALQEHIVEIEEVIDDIEKTIKAKRNTPEYFLGEHEIKDIEKIGIFQLIIDAFVKSPEFKHVLADINGVAKYKDIKQNLYKRVGHILKNSVDFKKNPEVWSYVVASLFPDLNQVVQEVKHDKNEGQTYYDAFLNTLLGV